MAQQTEDCDWVFLEGGWNKQGGMLISYKKRELAWIVGRTLKACEDLKHGLEDCYALLAPVDPGSTLVMSTPRNERVKGTITRVGTRIVKGVSLFVYIFFESFKS